MAWGWRIVAEEHLLNATQHPCLPKHYQALTLTILIDKKKYQKS